MFQFIRKHQALGLIFIGLVIVSFVIFFSPNQGGDRGGGAGGVVGTIDGTTVSRDEYVAAMKEVRLSRMLREGTVEPRNRSEAEESQDVMNRLFLLHQTRELGIQVPDSTVAAGIVELPFLQNERTKAFDQAQYEQFLALISRQGISQAEFEVFMKHNAAIQHLFEIGGLSGALVSSGEATEALRSESDQFSVQLVSFASSNFLSQIDLSPTNIANFYSNRLAQFRIPERLQVRYVKFAASNYFDQVDAAFAANTNLQAQMEAFYRERGADAFRDAQGNVMTQEAALADLREKSRTSSALMYARTNANRFANTLYKMPAAPDSLNQLAAESNLTVQVSSPFTASSSPPDILVPTSTFTRAAFALSEKEPFATPAVGSDGIYVYAYHGRIPAEIQPLESVYQIVTNQLAFTQARSLTEAAGRAFAVAASNAVAQSKGFEAAAQEAGLTVVTPPPFSPTSPALPDLPPTLTPSRLAMVADDLTPGSVSDYQPGGTGGFVLFLKERKPAPAEELQQQLPEALKQARQAGRASAFVEWQQQRLAAAQIQLPGMTAKTNAPAAAN